MVRSLISLLLILVFPVLARTQEATLEGNVSHNGKPVEFARVSIGDGQGGITDSTGHFRILHVPFGTYAVRVSAVGYTSSERKVAVEREQVKLAPFSLETVQEAGEVQVLGKSKTRQVSEEPFNVNAIDLKPLQNLNLTVNDVLNTTTGVRIRQNGGLGSDFTFSLNGFTGKQVRFFIDGLPTDYLGNAFSLNIVPVNILDRVEVYKGVVPVNLGADALGGAVNIVTKTTARDFLDISYGFGSFNTHQASAVARHTSKNGFMINLSGFYNYSANNYKIDAYLYDKQTGKKDENPTEVTRFNDAFQSSTGIFEIGFVNKRFADRLLIGLIASQSYKEIQQGANMTKVAGYVHRKEHSLIPTLKYGKDDLFTKGLSLNLSAIYSTRKAMTVDTSSRVYDWDGSYTEKAIYTTSGELNWYKTLFTFNDETALATATLEYKKWKHHTFTLNNTFTWFQRQGEDTISYSETPFSNPNVLKKNFLGLSYKLSLFDNRWETTVFGKSFFMESILYLEPDNEYEPIYRDEQAQSYQGYGIASAFFLFPTLQLKASYENAYRLPEGYEIFGDGLLLRSNYDLVAEHSHNFNVGFIASKRFNKHRLRGEFNFLYRLPENMIRLVAIGVASQYENLNSSMVTGYEAAVGYDYKHLFAIEVNATYQNMLNTNQLVNGAKDPLYLDRLPNIPYLFGNASFVVNTPYFGRWKNKLSFRWSTLCVEQFYLKWPSQGDKDYKNIIPRQIAHNASVTYSTKSGKYNISLSCNNLLDAKLYDNFRIQKPGRSFNLKFRYFISK